MQAVQTSMIKLAHNSSSVFPLQRKHACEGSAGLAETGHECQGQWMPGKPMQPKLTINEPGNEHERQADRVADQVTQASARHVVGDAAIGVPRFLPMSHASLTAAPDSVERVLASPGRGLDPALRQDMERRFGHDFSRVRIHADVPAQQSARDVAARAYTVGRNVVFGGGQYAPGTHEGRRLIAHELTHVLQQSGAEAVRAGPSTDERGLSPSSMRAHEAGISPKAGVFGTTGAISPGLLMRQPEDKNQADKPAVKTTTVADPCTDPDPQLPVYKEAEQKQRDQILQDMLRGLTATEKDSVCKRFRRALAAFSTGQMQTMKAAGVRFWRAGEFPPPFQDDYAPGKAKRNEMARYHPEVRVIQWGARAGVDEIRHELAHAWDHVRSGKIARLDAYKGARLKKAVQTPATFTSESDEKRLTVEIVEGKEQKVRLSVKEVFDRFMKRPAAAYWSFANTKTDPEHVTSDVREFYAEGYSVFHGDNEDAQAQLLCDAPELYRLLENEANEGKLAVPDRGKLAANNKTNNRKCVF